MRFIGITGGVGAGKSTILSYIKQEFSAKVVLADELAKELMAPGSACYEQIRESFADTDVFDRQGVLKTERMAQLVFSDSKYRKQLNAIVHPAVKQAVLSMVKREREKGFYDYFFFEAALLIEEGYDEICDELWYIYADETIRRQRLKDNRGYSDKKIDDVFASQKTDAVFRRYCKVVIDNSQETRTAFAQIQQILHEEKDR